MTSKLIAIVTLATILTGCAGVKPREQFEVTHITDFTPYAEKGFLITTGPYGGEYDGMGIVTVTSYAAVLLNESNRGGPITTPGRTSLAYRTALDLDQAVAALYEENIAMCVVRVMDLEIDSVYRYLSSGESVLDHATLTGLAIRRK